MAIILGILNLLSLLIIIEAVLSWVQPPSQSPRRELTKVTNPIYAPIRAVIPPGRLGGLDISPLIVLVLIRVATGFLTHL